MGYSKSDVDAITAALGEGLSDRAIEKKLGYDRRGVGKLRAAMAQAAQQQEPVAKPSTYAPDADALGRLVLNKLPDVVLVLPDLQFPYAHPDALNFLARVAQRYKPDAVVGIGDEIDAYFLSGYEKDLDHLEPSKELEKALEQCQQLFKMFPQVYACHSNHGQGRLNKARVRGGLLSRMVVQYRDLLGAPKGWGFYDEIRMGDVIFMHGDGEKGLTNQYLLKHAPGDYGRHFSFVHGHRHEMVGRVAEVVVGDRNYWAAYTGALINPLAPAFAYTKHRKAKLGCGLVVHGEYKQLRLERDDAGRWTGNL